MYQNRFQEDGMYFEQSQETTMGNTLSVFIANLFMSKFETELKKNTLDIL